MIALLLAAPLASRAQDDIPSIRDITYDQTVQDSITAGAFFDWWQLQALAGDMLVVDMAASGGLEPLLGILNPGGDLVARSEDGAPDAAIQLEYTVPSTGRYTVVATRVGNADGLSTGTYTLRVRRANPAPARPNPYQEVVFRCQDFEAATAATLTFADDPRSDLAHRITVYGLDGFQPVIRLTFSAAPDFEECGADDRYMQGDQFTLPGEPTRAFGADEQIAGAQLILTGAENMNTIVLTIASRDGAPGRYVALVEGFSIGRGGDRDLVELRLGPLAAQSTSLTVYMVAMPDSRLDSFMRLPEEDRACDDAGRRGCEDVLSFAGAGFSLTHGGGLSLTGRRGDAGLLLSPGSPDPVLLELTSRDGQTHGDYALVLIGELPPRANP